MEKIRLVAAVENQRQECKHLLSLPYIERRQIINKEQWLASPLIKVILGPRRAGKSSFALRLLKDHPFIYFNFDDPILLEEGLNSEELFSALIEAYGKDVHYILFDEIQNLPGWELFVNRLHRQGYNLIITGSNANLLSRELATHLTGRHIPISIMPFNFKEFLAANNTQQADDSLLRRYLASGGFPEVAFGGQKPSGYLDVLFDSLLFKDVIKRHNIRSAMQIDILGAYLIDNVANRYSFRQLASALEFKSVVTLEKYLAYLSEAYLFLQLSCFSNKTKIRLKSQKKIYTIDNGFVIAKAVRQSPDSGKLLENLVFTELLKYGYIPNQNLFYYQTRNGREIDFLLKNKQGNELLQVCYDLSAPATKTREIKALSEAATEIKIDKQAIITWQGGGEIGSGLKKVPVISLSKWLQEQQDSVAMN